MEFLISPNQGEDLKPLSKIASGGELSRIMLAMKSVISRFDEVETLIFDEVDAGVSGRAAQRWPKSFTRCRRGGRSVRDPPGPDRRHGRKALPDRKRTENGRTLTGTRLLTGGGTEKGLARIIGGARITELTLQNAGK